MKWLDDLIKHIPEFSIDRYYIYTAKRRGDVMPPWYMFPVFDSRYYMTDEIWFYMFPINLIIRFLNALNVRWNQFRMQDYHKFYNLRKELQPHIKEIWIDGYNKGFNHGILARNEILKRKAKQI